MTRFLRCWIVLVLTLLCVGCAATPGPGPSYAYVKPPVTQSKQVESKSWFGSWFTPEEPEKPKSVGEWMDSTKRIDP